MSRQAKSHKHSRRALRLWRSATPTTRRLVGTGAVITAVFAAVAVAAPLVAPYAADAFDAPQLKRPGGDHLFGTTNNRFDVFSRVVFGARLAFEVVIASTTFALCLGVPLGLVSGYVGGRADRVLVLVMDALYAFPSLLLAIVAAFALRDFVGQGVPAAALSIAVIYVPQYFRVVRNHTLSVREEPFVDAARAMGAPPGTVITRYVAANVLQSVPVIFTVNAADAVLTLAGLGFLGYGVGLETAEWGQDISRAISDVGNGFWWTSLFPGLAILVLVTALTLLGEGINDLLNPRLRAAGIDTAPLDLPVQAGPSASGTALDEIADTGPGTPGAEDRAARGQGGEAAPEALRPAPGPGTAGAEDRAAGGQDGGAAPEALRPAHGPAPDPVITMPEVLGAVPDPTPIGPPAGAGPDLALPTTPAAGAGPDLALPTTPAPGAGPDLALPTTPAPGAASDPALPGPPDQSRAEADRWPASGGGDRSWARVEVPPSPVSGPPASAAVLRLDDVHVIYGRGVQAVDGVSLTLGAGESLGLVGESGCGKSSLARATLGLLPPGACMDGRVVLDGDDLTADPDAWRAARGNRISMVFQEPATRLNPLQRIEATFVETIRTHRPEVSKAAARTLAAESLTAVGVPPERARQYPHEFSGGMRQRIMIALAVVLEPRVILADEPTTSLDVLVEAQVLRLLDDLRRRLGAGFLLVTHNLAVVAQTCDRVAVMYAGRVVESGPVAEVFARPRHPYTQGLLASVISLETTELASIPGTPPALTDPAPGCRFAPRCPLALPTCHETDPPETGGAHTVACHLYPPS